MKRILPYLSISLLVFAFFWQFFIKGLLPIPADTIVGLYHPFRDLYAKNYPNGIPFKNFLITDPVRQQYPWRELVVSIEKKLEVPLWNPYNFSGTPLLANFQSAPFYIFNVLFFIIPFSIAWNLMIFLGPLLGGIFLFLYLDNLKLSKWASVLGSMSFSFSGFSIAWMEWGTITHVALWLPLILLSIDKIFLYSSRISNSKYKIVNTHLEIKKYYFWFFLFIFCLSSSFFAGHLQIFFYLFIFSWVYFLVRWLQCGKTFNIVFAFLIFNILFLILSSVQWIPTLQFISLSSRNVDVLDFNNPGWFIPWQHIIQFVAPDFFGNPTTLNYWGVWNYGELVGYVGIMPLILAIFSMFFRKDKKTLFFGTILFLSLLFAFPTFFAKIPYLLRIPFLVTAQPTRLLFIVDFTLAILSAFGLDYFIRSKKRDILYSLAFVMFIFAVLWMFVLYGNNMLKLIAIENLSVAKNNLILPSLIFFASSILIILFMIFHKTKISTLILCCIIVVAVFDLFRFGWKFIPFTNKNYLFPSTRAISFLQKNIGEFRMMSTDARILPPNFSSIYRIQSIDGYNPLYLLRYGELIAASERRKADINPPFGFNRIITPHNYDSKIIDLLGVKFILSLSDLDSPKLKKVFQEVETRVYENANVLPKAFFVSHIIHARDKKEAIKIMFEDSFNPGSMVVIENTDNRLREIKQIAVGKADIVHYSENRIIIETENSEAGFLVITDSFYPTWKVKIDSRQENIYRADYNFRGVIVQSGKHRIEFYNSLF